MPLRSFPAASVRNTPPILGSAALLRSPKNILLLSVVKAMPGPRVSVMTMVWRVEPSIVMDWPLAASRSLM